MSWENYRWVEVDEVFFFPLLSPIRGAPWFQHSDPSCHALYCHFRDSAGAGSRGGYRGTTQVLLCPCEAHEMNADRCSNRVGRVTWTWHERYKKMTVIPQLRMALNTHGLHLQTASPPPSYHTHPSRPADEAKSPALPNTPDCVLSVGNRANITVI